MCRLPHHNAARRGRFRSERGMVTTEAALASILLLVLALGLVWALGLAVAQVELTAAVHAGARSAARGEDRARVLAVVDERSPRGSSITLQRHHDEVIVSGRLRATPPLGFGLVSFTLRARAEAPVEESFGTASVRWQPVGVGP